MYTTSAIFLPEVREFTKSGAMQLYPGGVDIRSPVVNVMRRSSHQQY